MRRPRLAPSISPACAVLAWLVTACGSKPAQRIPSVATGAPVVVTMPSGRTDVFVLGSDGNVWQSTCRKDCTKHTSFSDWSRLPGRPPGGATSDPGGVAWGEDRIDLFIRGADGNLWHQTWDDGAWLGWEDLGGQLGWSPVAASWQSGRLDVVALCGDGRLWHRWCQAGDVMPRCRGLNWAAWLPDPQGPPVAAVSTGSMVSSSLNRIDFAVLASDGALWFQRWESSYYIGWRSLGGKLGSSPALVAFGGRLEAYARTPEGALIRGTIDSPDVPLAWKPTNLEVHAEPRGVAPTGTGKTLLISRPAGSHAFEAITCVPDAECTRME